MASSREANSKADTSVTADQQKKLLDKVDRCKQDSQKVSNPDPYCPDQGVRAYIHQGIAVAPTWLRHDSHFVPEH